MNLNFSNYSGVWYRPRNEFQKWKDRGCNLLVGYDAGGEGSPVSIQDYINQGTVNPFQYNIILQDMLDNGTSTSAWWNHSNVVAISLPDEAMVNWVPALGRPYTAGELNTRVASIRARTNKPVFLNFSGWHFQYFTDTQLAEYLNIIDWIAFDWYIVERGETMAMLPKVLEQIDRLKRLSGGKPIFACLGISDQALNKTPWLNQPNMAAQKALARPPTLGEVLKQYWEFKARGCDIIYFPDKIGAGWEAYDATVPEVADILQYLK